MKKKSRPHTPNTIEKSSGIQRKINTKKKYRLEKKKNIFIRTNNSNKRRVFAEYDIR